MEKDKNLSSLPLNALAEIPTPSKDAQRIVALTKKDGVISGYKLEDGRVVTKAEGVALARNGGILGVGIATNEGSEYLKSLPDDSESNNLGSLPTEE